MKAIASSFDFFQIALLVVSSSIFFSSTAFAHKPEIVPREVLVKYKASLPLKIRTQAIKRAGGKTFKFAILHQNGLAQVHLPTDQSVEDAINIFQSQEEVEYAQPNFVYHALTVPNDPQYSQLWALKNTGQTIYTPTGASEPADSTNNPGKPNLDMNFEFSWDFITDCSSVVVAVVDTGIQYNHTDLATNMWDGGQAFPHHGFDFVENSNDPMDQNGHGTHVAGTIGAIGNNGIGTTGICWKGNLMAVRVLDKNGEGSTLSVAQGIEFAVDHGARVINLSLGGSSYDPALESAVNYANDHQVAIVTAAGNNGTDNELNANYPCNFTAPLLLCVAALDQNYELASFSNYGSNSVDVGAPGVNIVSTYPFTNTIITDNLNSSWIYKNANFSSSTGWGYKKIGIDDYLVSSLVNPAQWNLSTQTYVNNADDQFWKSFNLTSGYYAVLSYFAAFDLNLNDYLYTTIKAGTDNPFSGGSVLDSITQTQSDGYISYYAYDISSCAGKLCSIGFELKTDSSNTNFGALITLFEIDVINQSLNSINVLEGTSMATPHATGLLAMLLAFNPDYSVNDALNSIKKSGIAVSSLSNKTTTGRAIHSANALTYIQPPTGITLKHL